MRFFYRPGSHQAEPSCALAYYIFDLKKEIGNLGESFEDFSRRVGLTGKQYYCNRYFDISEKEAAELFGAHGCDNAKTPEQAARYIEEFVAARIAKDFLAAAKPAEAPPVRVRELEPA